MHGRALHGARLVFVRMVVELVLCFDASKQYRTVLTGTNWNIKSTLRMSKLSKITDWNATRFGVIFLAAPLC